MAVKIYVQLFRRAAQTDQSKRSKSTVPRYWDAGRLYKRSKVDKISFPNGDIIKHGSRDFGGNRCGNNYSYTLEKRDRSGDILLNKMLFLLYDNPASTEIWSACSIAGDLDHYTGFADALYPTFVPLEDGTFLAVDFELVIRLRSDLTSPYIDNKRLFLVDTAVIDRLVEKAYARPGQAIQNANDAIRDYFFILKKGN